MKYFVLIFSIIILCLSACNHENDITTSSSAELRFSCDTVNFDTIFTEQNSRTYRLLIYNPNDNAIKVSQISLRNGKNSHFQMNVNGESGSIISDVKIYAHDSLFVFFRANLTANEADTLVTQTELLDISCNGNVYTINLLACSQDAQRISTIITENTIWSSSKPYYITDSLLIAQGACLRIEQGVKIYLHKNANIIVKGSLQMIGDCENPVILLTDNLGKKYQQNPGEWGSIIFDSASVGNQISHTEIYNSTNGIYIKSGTGAAAPMIDLQINDSKIYYASSSGIYCQNGKIDAKNLLIADCSEYAMKLEGGKYSFIHSTFVYRKAINTKYSPIIYLSDFVNQINTPFQFECYNSIISRGSQKMLKYEKHDENNLCKFDYCLFDFAQNDTEKITDIVWGDSLHFKPRSAIFDLQYADEYLLDTISVARYKSNPEYSALCPNDLKCNYRLDTIADLGAIQYYYKPPQK